MTLIFYLLDLHVILIKYFVKIINYNLVTFVTDLFIKILRIYIKSDK